MKIAIPLAGGKLATHFGHCERFALLDADEVAKTTGAMEVVAPPPHEPGLYPAWLAKRGATHIIAGGMGQRARDLFAQNGISVVVGAPEEEPGAVASLFLNGNLATGDNRCDH